MNHPTKPPYFYAVIDAARDFARIRLAEHCGLWSESLFEGKQAKQLEHVAPHLFACDFEGTVPWMVLRQLGTGEAGVVLQSSLSFHKVRHELRKRLNVVRQKSNRKAYFRFYDPRVLRVFLPVCTREELAEFFGPFTKFHIQSTKMLHVTSYHLDASGALVELESHIDDFLVQNGFCEQEEMDAAALELPAVRAAGAEITRNAR